MPYTKKFNGKKFMRKIKRKYRAVKKGNKSTSVAYRALKLAKSIQKGIEYKYADYPLVADDLAANGTCYSLVTGLAKGDTVLNRTGDTIKLARAHLDFTVHLPVGSTATNTRTFRILVVRGKREDGVNYAPGLTTSASRGILDDSVMPLILARKAVNNSRDSIIMFDRTYTLTPGQKTKYEFRWKFKLGWVCRYSSDTANLVEDGGLYLITIADYNNGDILTNFNHRITYSDL